MKKQTLQDIDANTFADAVDAAEITFTPAFVHGLLTAYCCAEKNTHGWAATLISDIDPNNETQTTQLRYLNQAKNVIGTQLADSELSFQLLLHNTADTLHDEVLLTREWASGYWLGVTDNRLNEKVSHDDLSNDFLEDIQTIITMPTPSDDMLSADDDQQSYNDQYDESEDIYDTDKNDDTRTDIMQIQEYCRAGAIGVFLAAWKD